MHRLTKNRNRKPILKNISLSYFYGAKIGVLGLTVPEKALSCGLWRGLDNEYEGEVMPVKGYTIGFLEQEPLVDVTKTVEDVIREGVGEVDALLKEFEEINAKFAEPMDDDAMNKLLERQAAVQEKLDAADAWDMQSRIDMAMDALRCPPGNKPVNVLSGGERRRVALCRLLLKKPDILLLDEPTNHLDAETVAWLEHHLQSYAGTVIAVTHDRYFLDNVAGWILELDRGEGIPWKGNYSSWLEQKEKRLEKEEKDETQRRKTLQRELEWIRMTPKARQTKSKSRISSYETMLMQDVKEKVKDLAIYIPPGPRLGDICIDADGLSKIFGEQILFENLSFKLPSGGIVGVIGPNGAGKSTLFKLITGQEKADKGTIKIGETVKLTYIDQSRETLNDEKTVWENISGGDEIMKVGPAEINSRAYCAKFNFQGADQQKKLNELSGGERNRVHLAKALKEGGNVILLDEPTNDLDVNTLRALEEGLENFAGCAVIISHDRYFLDRIATHILAFEGNSSVIWFEGNFSDYEADKKRRLGDDADIPKRIKYRYLTR
ncbi:hypothetical protein CHS0354_030105 [Potamilus streckersoni]|uniref:ABC transporter domain-containing protein n=1 Tax=Potamilus streckersoni TaxID=2493646 RepID=A0AAE0VDH7_9BIVA|nr:hypothetical protein CHS0354_030105 [Potamilus streckersoni]